MPQLVSRDTQRILVEPSLQHCGSGREERPPVFAIGDVAETGAPKTGRAAFMQAAVAARNIVKLVQGKINSLEIYICNREIEGVTKITLGKVSHLSKGLDSAPQKLT
jgi:NADH dehydrogenase FAD-containing subunit